VRAAERAASVSILRRVDPRHGKLRVLAVGQTPPPYGGQAIAIESFVRGTYDHLEVAHVRMGFSSDMRDVGRFRLSKLFHLVGLIMRILWSRFTTGAEVLYYPPAGPDLVPVVRDIAVLLSTRWAFKRTVFHFHAGGLAEIYPRLPRPARAAFRRAYFYPDLAITPAPMGTRDAPFVHARRHVVVANGVPELPSRLQPAPRAPSARPVVLYVGVLRESKGVLDLLRAVAAVKSKGLACEVQLMGQVASAEFDIDMQREIRTLGLEGDVTLLGVRTGIDKDEAFSKADVFCYPTRFESETFGIVVVEAMRSALPVVATAWRGVPSLVRDGETGFLVPIRDVDALADRLAVVIADADLRTRLGACGRQVFLENFTEERFRRAMEDELARVSESV
jgi:glycosyltransferase involved in cell wall biosynthesis